MVVGHKKMIIWHNMESISEIIFERIIPVIPHKQFALRDQIERATTSIGANFIEGYYSGSTREFIRFLGYSRRSLAELEFWVSHCSKRKYIHSTVSADLEDIIINTGYLTDRLILSLKNKEELNEQEKGARRARG
jgi:four helix bundle protein